jgi:tetratricopeptide (TPR) repeat protein
VIREEQPTRPSTISKQLRGDVETIALKALEKERDRRYQSAVELAQDIRRYLAGQAIVGRPPSILYQLRIFARRHKALFGALTAVFVVLAVGLVVSTGMYLRAERERGRALASEAEAEAVITFLSDTLASVDPAEVQGREMTIEGMLDKAAKDIDTAFTEQPLVEATLRTTIGKTYYALGNYPSAERHLETAFKVRKRELGDEHPETLVSMDALAMLYDKQGRYDEAESLYRRTLDLQRRVLGVEHPYTLSTMHNLADLLLNRGRLDECKPLFVEAFELRRRVLGEEHRDTLASMVWLAYVYMCEGRLDESESLWLRGLELQRRVLGEEHPDTLTTMHYLAWLYGNQGRHDEALSQMVEAHEIQYRVMGEEHPDTLASMNDLAYFYYCHGRYDEAEPLYVRALELQRRAIGEASTFTLYSHWGLARTLVKQGKWQEAETLAIDFHKKINSAAALEHFGEKDAIELFIELYDAWGKPEKAAEWREKLPEPEGESVSQPAG